MLTEVIIQTSTPTSLKIDDVDPDEILILESISGLSDVKVNQFMGDFAREGSYYQGRRGEKRNPVFNFKIQPNYGADIEASDIREMIYRMFMEPQRDSDAVQVLLKDDRKPDRYFIGYTETINSDIFTKDLKAQASLMTTDAYLRSATVTQAEYGLGWFGVPLTYEGSADTGLQVTIKVLKETYTLTLSNGIDVMNLSSLGFMKDDIITINTQHGEKSILRNGVDAMSVLTPDSDWLQLKEQGNHLKVWGTTEGDGAAIITSYLYRAAWWGI